MLGDYTINKHFRAFLLSAQSIALIYISVIIFSSISGAKSEFSIYNEYNTLFWLSLSLIVVVFVGISTIWFTSTILWKKSFLLLLITYSLFFLLPIFAGYWLYSPPGGDVLVHLAKVKSILDSGHVGARNWYPTIHILTSVLSLIGVNIRRAPLIITMLFTPLFIVGQYTLSKLLFNKKMAMIVSACSVVLLFGKFHHSFHPAVLSTMLLPLAITLHFRNIKRNSIRNTTLLLIFSLTIVLFHPISGAILLIFFTLSPGVISQIPSLRSENINIGNTHILTLGILYTIWYLSFKKTGIAFTRSTVGSILLATESDGGGSTGPSSNTIFDQLISNILSTSKSPVVITFEILIQYGPMLFFVFIAGVASTIIIKGFLEDRFYSGIEYIAMIFIVSMMFGSILIFFDFIVFDFRRALRFAVLSSIIMVGYSLYVLCEMPGRRSNSMYQVFYIVLIILLMIAAPLSVLSSYEQGNNRAQTEIAGTKFLIQNIDDELNILYFRKTIELEMYIRGERRARDNFILRSRPEDRGIPKNLQFNVSHSNISGYLITKEYDVNFGNTKNQVQLYSAHDVRRLHNSTDTYKIYENGDFKMWRL